VTGPDADFKLEGRLEFQRKEFKMPGGRILGVVYRLIEHRDSASGRFGLSDAHIETFPPEREWDVGVLNDNKPCDSSRDVWSYD